MLMRTLGEFALYEGSLAAPGQRVLGPAKPIALILYLAYAPDRRALREELIELLWRGSDADRARGTLRQTLWALRRRLGEGALVSDGDAMVLASPPECDSIAFEAAVLNGDLQRAWALYAGDFVPDFAAHGAVAFDAWAAAQRSRLQSQWVDLGEARVRQALSNNQQQEAMAVIRRLVAAVPARQDLWALVGASADPAATGARIPASQGQPGLPAGVPDASPPRPGEAAADTGSDAHAGSPALRSVPPPLASFLDWLRAEARAGRVVRERWPDAAHAAAEFLGPEPPIHALLALAQRVPWHVRLRYGWSVSVPASVALGGGASALLVLALLLIGLAARP